MKRSIQDQIRKLLAVKKPEPTALYEPAPMENESAVESITPKGGGNRGTEGCDYSSGAGDSGLYGGRDPNNEATTTFVAYDRNAYGGCPVCNGGAPPAFCACIAAYNNPCYNWHWSKHWTDNYYPPPSNRPERTWEPPAYPSYPPGCPSREELTAPGYTVEEWVGNPETLSGQRYIWGNWNWISRVQRPDGSFEFPNHVDPAIEFPFNCGPDPVRNPDYDPLDPDSVCGYVDGQRIYMRDVYAFWFSANPSYVGMIPSLLERRKMEMGCYGVPFVRSTGSCCTFPDFGGAECRDVQSASACEGVFIAGGSCSGDNPCGGLDQNPIQQNDQAKNQKQAIDMVMSILKRK